MTRLFTKSRADECVSARAVSTAFSEAEPHPLSPTWTRLEALHDLTANWNGGDIPAPAPDAIENARGWINSFYLDAKRGNLAWISPHVSADEEGRAAFEWARGRKRLVVYVSPEETVYIKAWGPSIVSEMEDGSANTPEERTALWAWLTE